MFHISVLELAFTCGVILLATRHSSDGEKVLHADGQTLEKN